MRDYMEYATERANLAENITEKLQEVLKQNDEALTINELLKKLKVPFTDITAREALWKLIDQDVIELTPERKLKYVGNGNGRHNGNGRG